MTEQFDVRIEERLYDAKRGVTVVRISFDPPNGSERVIVKGVAFTAPEDQYRQTKREGTFHAILHACQHPDGDLPILDEALLAAVRQGLFSWDMAQPAQSENVFEAPGEKSFGPIGPLSFVILG